jgi:phosphatidylglycerophosphate synthase
LGTSSTFGATLDKECDAFFVAAISSLLWLSGIAGPWVFVAGIWRYLYGLIVAISPGGQTAPRSNWGRYSYSTACVSLILALVPNTGLSVYLAGFASVVISLSFARSLYYSFLRS